MTHPTNMREPPQKDLDMSIGDREPIPDLPSPEERRRLREAFGVSMTELANELGNTTRQSVAKYESGTANPTGERRVKYARILNQWAERLRRDS